MPRGYVLFCTPFFREPGAGLATGGLLSNFHMVRALARGHDVRVLSLDPRPPSSEAAARFGYQVASAPARTYAPGVNYLVWRRDVLRALEAARSQWGDPALLVAASSTMHTLRDALPGARKVGVIRAFENFGLRVPDGDLTARLAAFRNGLKQHMPQRAALAHADRVIVNSAYMAGQVRRVLGSDRCEVLYPCIDIATPERLEPGEGVGFVNRGGAKGLELVVELARRLPQVPFKVFGKADLGPDAPANLSPMGWWDEREAMFGAARLWIVPSRWNEPFGRVAAEAQAYGRRVIVSNRGGLPEAVTGPGRVLDGFDPDAWAQAITETLAEPPDEARAREVSRMALERFGTPTHDARVAEIFEALL